MEIDRIDHPVLTVRDIAATVEFYTAVLGMTGTRFGEGRVALCFGGGRSTCMRPGPGSSPRPKRRPPAPPDEAERRDGPIRSLHIRGPEGNPIEISRY